MIDIKDGTYGENPEDNGITRKIPTNRGEWCWIVEKVVESEEEK